MANILYLSDNLIALNGPVDRSTGAAVSSSPTSCVARIYHETKETRVAKVVTRLTLELPGAASSFSIPSILSGTFKTVDLIKAPAEITYDDGVVRSAAIGGPNPSYKGYDPLLASPLVGVAAVGNRVEFSTYATGATLIPVEGIPVISAGDSVELRMDDGTLEVGTATEVSTATIREDATASGVGTRTELVAIGHDPIRTVKTTATTAAISAGARVRVKLGPDITMTSFGSFPTSNPVAGDTAWGFRGTIPDTLVSLKSGMKVRVEIEYNGGAGLKHISSLVATVMEHSG